MKQFFTDLAEIPADAWQAFSELFNEGKLAKGEYFIKDGQIAREIGFLETGIVRAYYRNDRGQEYNKHFFVAPCLMGGYASIISGSPNQINQQAMTDCQIRVANFSQIQDLYSSFPSIERVARILAERFFVQKEQREIELVLLAAEKRYEIFQKHFPTLEQQLPQYHIASYLGITPTQLSRIRKSVSTR